MVDTWDAVDGFTFAEPASSEQCYVGVRARDGQVLLALSRRTDGDVQVGMPLPEAERLVRALQSALARLRGGGG